MRISDVRLVAPSRKVRYGDNEIPVVPPDGTTAHFVQNTGGYYEGRNWRSLHEGIPVVPGGRIPFGSIVTEYNMDADQLKTWTERGVLREAGTIEGGQFVPTDEFREFIEAQMWEEGVFV